MPNKTYCSNCGAELNNDLITSEDGQLDYPWCLRCVDFVDPVEEPRGTKDL